MTSQEMEFIFNNIVGEIDAIKLYNDAINKSGSADVIEVLSDIRDEEMVHLGELIYLAMKIDSQSALKFLDGCSEAEELLQKMSTSEKESLD